ncbi:hypothetical protein VN24_10465 [Paenibacillus beijingensis]|uniref:Uncharacterized protein n=2 Tax=Paenibacillus beijingensis TaxID=1126833 RepID=A0A0D5NR85_9BACL|nr:hypothetical protein VN24_10465 [Paenibacillus beijingensis]
MFGAAAVMAGAALVSKLLGTMQKIPLQNVAGDRVFGIYNAVYPFYQLLLVLATAGLPVAVSLLVAQRLEAGDLRGARRIRTAGLLLLGSGGAAGFAAMWTGAPVLAGWIGDPAVAPAIRTVSLALWTVPALAALRGYAQGIGVIAGPALSQLAEQTVRVAAMIALLAIGWEAGWSEAGLAAGAMSGSAFGGAAGLLFMAVYLRGRRGADETASAVESLPDARTRQPGEGRAGMSSDSRHAAVDDAPGKALDTTSGQRGIAVVRHPKKIAVEAHLRNNIRTSASAAASLRQLAAEMKRLAALALPVALGAIVVPVAGAVDAFTVPRLMHRSGMTAAEAMEQFGIYSRCQPLVQLVVMVAAAAASALVPAIARARFRGDAAGAARQASLAMRAAWLIGLPASAGLALLAGPLNVMLYGDDTGRLTFALVGSTALAGALNAVAAPALQGLGAVRLPAAFLLASALLKAALNAALVPALGIAGAAWAGIAALGAAALLGAAAVARAARAAGGAAPLPARGRLRAAAGTAAALAVMAAALLAAERALQSPLGRMLPPRAAAAALALTGVAVGAGAYAAALLRCGGIGARELRALPGGEALAARLERWRLLPPRR